MAEFPIDSSIGGVRILELLGTGTFSTVLRVRVESGRFAPEYQGREMAAKVVGVNFMSEWSRRIRPGELPLHPSHEADILWSIEPHEGIVDLHSFFTVDDWCILLFTHAEHRDLWAVMHPHGEDDDEDPVPFEEPHVIDFMRLLGHAVTHLHNHGIVHRDVKPANVLACDYDGVHKSTIRPALTDFGFAKRLVIDSPCRTLLGTPAFMAPEMHAVALHLPDRTYGFPVDVWAMGLTLYVLLTADLPWTNSDPIDVQMHTSRVLDHVPADVLIDARVRRVIRGATELVPTDRPNAHDFWWDLATMEETRAEPAFSDDDSQMVD